MKNIGLLSKIVISRVGRGGVNRQNRHTHALMVWGGWGGVGWGGGREEEEGNGICAATNSGTFHKLKYEKSVDFSGTGTRSGSSQHVSMQDVNCKASKVFGMEWNLKEVKKS